MLVPELSYYINLVFWYLKLVLVLSLPLIGYVIRRKWRFAEAKEAEIKRLMLLAAEESARAEREAAETGYYAQISENRAVFHGIRADFRYQDDEVQVNRGAALPVVEAEIVSGGGMKVHQCAVCGSPTTKRCERCKSVRYCSAKCQIFHWRGGHRNECHPPSVSSSDAESKPISKPFSQEKDESHNGFVEIEDRWPLEQPQKHLGEKPISGVYQADKLHEKADGSKNKFVQGVKPLSPPASFSTAFSSDSSSSSVSSDLSDDASVTGSSASSEFEKVNVRQHADALNQVKSISRSFNVNETRPSDVKGISPTPSKVRAKQGIINAYDGLETAYTTSCSNAKVSNPSVAKSGASDFWEGTLDYRWSNSDTPNSQATDNTLSDIGSSLRSASGLIGNNVKSGRADGQSYLSFPKPRDELDIFNKKYPECSKVESPLLCSSKLARRKRDEITNGESNADAPRSSDSSVVSSKKSDDAPNGINHLSKLRSSSASDGGETFARLKTGNACQAYDTSQSQAARRSSLSAERLGRVPNINESGVDGLQLNSHVTHASTYDGRKLVSSVAKVDGTKPSSNVSTSSKGHRHPLNVANGLKSSALKVVDHLKASKLSRGSLVAERLDNKGLFSYEMFKNLYGWNKVELEPCGLINCGNSCYANVVLQCLSFTPPLTAYLLQGLHSRYCNKSDWCFTCEFENLILKAKDGSSPVSPIGIISQLPSIGSQLSNGREEDAHEFLRYVVDTMQSLCIREANKNVMATSKENTTLVGLTFGGYLQSKIRCMKCGSKSERPERIMDLSVEIEGNVHTLEEALKRFTSTETLDADNKYNCARCKSYQKAKKKLTLLEAPNILTIALKRFQAGKFGKLNKYVEFPEILDMAPYMSGTSDDKAPVYKLYGVIVHLDTMNASFSGHYVCYVKNIQNKWFRIDDSVVKTVEFKKVKEQGAYMLLYARCLPRAPRSVRDKTLWDSKTMAKPPPSVHCPVASGPNSPDSDYSDTTSIFSSCSDENSCSTESSTRESNSADDLSDLLSGRWLRNPWKCSSDSDNSSPSTSPLCSEHHHQHHGNQRHMESSGGIPFLCSDPTSHCRNVDCNCSYNSSNCRLSETERLTSVDSVRYGVPSRRSTSARRG